MVIHNGGEAPFNIHLENIGGDGNNHYRLRIRNTHGSNSLRRRMTINFVDKDNTSAGIVIRLNSEAKAFHHTPD